MYFFVETFEDCGSVGDLMIFAGLDLKGKYCHNTVTSCILFLLATTANSSIKTDTESMCASSAALLQYEIGFCQGHRFGHDACIHS